MGAMESANAFLAGVLAKLPTELQAQAKTLFEAPEAKDALITIGDGVLARSEFSKQMDALATKEAELTTRFEDLNSWYGVNEQALKDYRVIKPEFDRLKGAAPVKPGDPLAEPVDTRKVVEDVLNESGREYVAVSAWLAAQSVRHLHTFNEPLDAMALVQHPKLGKPVAGQPGRVFSLQDAYQEQFGERLAGKAKEADDKRINDEVDKRLAERMKGVNSGHPFPLRNDSPSVLDVLTTKDGPAVHSLDTAVAEYERLQQTRGA